MEQLDEQLSKMGCGMMKGGCALMILGVALPIVCIIVLIAFAGVGTVFEGKGKVFAIGIAVAVLGTALRLVFDRLKKNRVSPSPETSLSPEAKESKSAPEQHGNPTPVSSPPPTPQGAKELLHRFVRYLQSPVTWQTLQGKKEDSRSTSETKNLTARDGCFFTLALIICALFAWMVFEEYSKTLGIVIWVAVAGVGFRLVFDRLKHK
jgi:hypothetical protein